MDARVPETLDVDAFEMRFADIAEADIGKLHALSIAVGWPHRAEDWQYLRELGHGFVALDEIDRVLGSAMWFPHGKHFGTMGMLITSPRLQTNGTAKWLMQRVMAEFPDMSFRLNATRAARRLYRSLGFQPQKTVYQCQGEAMVPALAERQMWEGKPVLLSAEHLDAIVALDAPAFAVPRKVHLAKLLQDSQCYGLFRDDQLVAYSMSRRFGRGHVIGPIVAHTQEDAVAVCFPHVSAYAGTFLRVDTHFETGFFAGFIQQCGMPIFDTVTTMTLGPGARYGEGDNGDPVTFALASQALG